MIKPRVAHALPPLANSSPIAQPQARVHRWAIPFALIAIILILISSAGFWLAIRFDPLGRAQAEFDRREYRIALNAAEDHLKRFPNDRRASLMAARCASRLGLSRRAKTHYHNAASLDIDDLQDQAYGLFLLQEPESAAEVYQQLLNLQPTNALALKRSAAVLMGWKKYKTIPELGNRLLAIPGEEIAGRTLLGIGHHELKHYPQASEAFIRVLQLDPDLKTMPLPRTLFWNHLANDLMAQGRNPEARDFLRRALNDSDDDALIELLGLTHHYEGNFDLAEQCWLRALDRNPDNAEAWLDLGRLDLLQRRPGPAVTRLKRAAELAPASVEAYHNLSQAYQMLGNASAAELYRQKAASLRKLNPRLGGMGFMPDQTSANREREPGR